jgi:hypothetical protein
MLQVQGNEDVWVRASPARLGAGLTRHQGTGTAEIYPRVRRESLIATLADKVMCILADGRDVSNWFPCAGSIAVKGPPVSLQLSHRDLKAAMRMSCKRLALERHTDVLSIARLTRVRTGNKTHLCLHSKQRTLLYFPSAVRSTRY